MASNARSHNEGKSGLSLFKRAMEGNTLSATARLNADSLIGQRGHRRKEFASDEARKMKENFAQQLMINGACRPYGVPF